MKKQKPIIITAIIMAILFSATIFSACTKSSSTPTTNIQIENSTFTPITITVNGTTSTIAVGGIVTYSGSAGSVFAGSAYTYGTYNGVQVGTRRSWILANTFPSSGSILQELSTGTGVFYLYIKNSNATYPAQGLYVNQNNADSTFDNVTIPNNGSTYGIGYYLANTGGEIYMNSSPAGHGWTLYPTFPLTDNQTVVMNLP